MEAVHLPMFIPKSSVTLHPFIKINRQGSVTLHPIIKPRMDTDFH